MTVVDRTLDSVIDAALEAFYGKPGRAFTPASRDRMLRALRAARGADGGRTLTIDLDTGAWVDGGPLHAGDGARVAAAVLPGMPEAEIDAAYSDYMRDDAAPAPEATFTEPDRIPSFLQARMDPSIARAVGRLRGGIEL
jgi:hypothetical protein